MSHSFASQDNRHSMFCCCCKDRCGLGLNSSTSRFYLTSLATHVRRRLMCSRLRILSPALFPWIPMLGLCHWPFPWSPPRTASVEDGCLGTKDGQFKVAHKSPGVLQWASEGLLHIFELLCLCLLVCWDTELKVPLAWYLIDPGLSSSPLSKQSSDNH
jgi:hypothetical protein